MNSSRTSSTSYTGSSDKKSARGTVAYMRRGGERQNTLSTKTVVFIAPSSSSSLRVSDNAPEGLGGETKKHFVTARTGESRQWASREPTVSPRHDACGFCARTASGRESRGIDHVYVLQVGRWPSWSGNRLGSSNRALDPGSAAIDFAKKGA